MIASLHQSSLRKLKTMAQRSRILILVAMALILAPLSKGQVEKSSPLESITEAELRDHIYFLASDYLAGRAGPSAEYEIAAQYVATQFASGGLEPLISEKGNMEGYFQEVPYEKMLMGKEAGWVLHTKDGQKTFKHNEDYKILEGRFFPEGSMDVVFAGYGIHEPDYGWDDFEKLDIKGKMVLVMAGAPTKKGEAVLPDSIHKQYNSMMGLQKKAMPVIKMGPSAIVLMMDKATSAMLPFDRIPSNLQEEMYNYLGPVSGEGSLKVPMVYLVKDEVIRTFFEGQRYDPVNIEDEGIRKYKTYQLKDLSIETKFSVLETSGLTLKNVVGVVRGSDPELSKQFIAVGAHLDHVAFPGGQVANGADDNASGSAGVMEIAEAVAQDPPRRSVVFIAYTAEEMGLQGSHFFVNAGPLALEDMKFNVNLDMIGRTTAENMDTRAHYVLGDSKYKDQLIPFISGINESSIQYPLIYDFEHAYSGSSDHASYSNAGIPSFFFFSGSHKDLHTPGDDADKIEYDKAEKISRLAYLITMKLANMDEVPDFLE
jgi:hypothetical protein